jgi:putative oxidoreductase
MCQTNAGAGVMLLRLFLAWIFIAAGAGKLFGAWGGVGIQGFTGFLTKIGIPSPEIMAYVVGWTELVAGLLLLFGFLTRLAAVAIMIMMAVAIAKVHLNDFNYPAVVLLSALALLEVGSGVFSIDHLIAKKQ